MLAEFTLHGFDPSELPAASADQKEQQVLAEWLKKTIHVGVSIGFSLVEAGIGEERAELLLARLETAEWLRLPNPETPPFRYTRKALCATRSRALCDFLRPHWGACPYCCARDATWRRMLDEDAALLIACASCGLEFQWSDWVSQRFSVGELLKRGAQ